MKRIFAWLVFATLLLNLFAQEEIVFPDGLSPSLVGKEVIIKNPMYVVQTYYRAPEGPVELSSGVLRVPTDAAFPGSREYRDVYERNDLDRLRLEGEQAYTDKDGTLRIGEKTENLRGTLGYASGKYFITPTKRPVFSGNLRSDAPRDIGNCNLKVASFNLEYFMASPENWGNSNGAADENEFRKQRSKILAALLALDADVYALCEVEEGGVAVKDLTEGLNRISGSGKYKYVEDYDQKVTSYTKNVFIYNSETVSPYLAMKKYTSTYLPKRHIAQAFDLLSNGERVIISLNHFKSKSGTGSGSDADQGDGQGNYNVTRVDEARNCVAFFGSLAQYYGDSDILVVGDLNAYAKEDPVKVFTDAGYTDELRRYSPDNYSYSYKREAGYLDHSLSSPSLTGQVSGAVIWNINADEPDYVGYKYAGSDEGSPYRCSDHNPVVTGLRLGAGSHIGSSVTNDKLVVSPPSDGVATLYMEGMERVELYSFSGQLVHSGRANGSGFYALPVGRLKGGLYLVKAYKGGRFKTAKVIVG